MQPATVTPLSGPPLPSGPVYTGRAPGALASGGCRAALAGFFVAGILLAFPGAILPAWQHHISSDYLTVGLYFVALIAGLIASVRSGSLIIARKGLSWTLACSCASAAVGLVGLALASPPVPAWWRLLGIAVIGWAAGLLHRAIFQAITPMYRHDPAATVNLAGILFGLGCFAVALFVSRTYYTYTPAAIQIFIALVPAFFAISYARRPIAGSAEEIQAAPRHVLLTELKTPGAVLLSLVLFFQLGNEWAIAGWLPLFLSQRLGMSPQAAVMILAIYWLALLIGRVAAQWILPKMRHSRLLGLCLLISMFACVVLLFTDNQFGAVSGVVLLGFSFAPIYPLIVERIGRRFPDYRPGFYNGIFSIALAGGMLAPSTLGYFAWLLDVRAVMALPLCGSAVVFVLLAGLWTEERLVSSGLSKVAVRDVFPAESNTPALISEVVIDHVTIDHAVIHEVAIDEKATPALSTPPSLAVVAEREDSILVLPEIVQSEVQQPGIKRTELEQPEPDQGQPRRPPKTAKSRHARRKQRLANQSDAVASEHN